jgi:acetyl esterase/lipase
MYMEQVPRYVGPPDMFPASVELPEGAKRIAFKDRDGFGVDFLPDVVYDERASEKLHLQLMLPMDEMAMFLPQRKKYPLIVYVPGSAWMRQNVYISLQRMLRVCERGYAVAVVQYRPSDVAGFPAQIEDAKTAIRFMRKNAGLYGIEAGKVASWGDSSGGHTVVMAAITDDGVCDNGMYGEYSCNVKCVVDWFGPTDISMMNFYPGMMDHTEPQSPEGLLLGGVDVLKNPERAQKTNPMNYLSVEKAIPPILIIHGDSDAIVPFNQSVRLYEKLRQLNKAVEMYKLEGAGHGINGFNSDGVIDLTLEYIAKYIG